MSNTTDERTDYEVGYGRPPRSGQFKKGCSGNPSGGSKTVRTRRSKTGGLNDLLCEGMQRPIEIEENGKKVVLTLLHLTIRRRVEEAATGKMRALKELLKLREVKDGGPIAPGRRLVLTLDEAMAAGPLGHSLYGPNVVIIRGPKPGAKPVAKRRTAKDELNLRRRSAAELFEIELDRRTQVKNAATGETKRMTMREVIAEQLIRLVVAGRPGASELMMKLNRQVTRARDHKVYIGVPWNFEMPPQTDIMGQPLERAPVQDDGAHSS